MALIYLLNNLIIVSDQNELRESLNLPQILLSSLHLIHCPKHPITSPPCTISYTRATYSFLVSFCAILQSCSCPTGRGVCAKPSLVPPFWDMFLSPSQFKDALFSTLGFYNPTIRRSRMALGNPGLVLVAFVSASQQP